MEINSEKQLLNTVRHTIEVTMSGNSMDDTVGKLFQMMRKQVFHDFQKPIIQMEAEEVFFTNVDIKEKKEAFLFLFMPRVKRYFTITAKIVVLVKYLDLEKEDI